MLFRNEYNQAKTNLLNPNESFRGNLSLLWLKKSTFYVSPKTAIGPRLLEKAIKRIYSLANYQKAGIKNINLKHEASIFCQNRSTKQIKVYTDIQTGTMIAVFRHWHKYVTSNVSFCLDKYKMVAISKW